MKVDISKFLSLDEQEEIFDILTEADDLSKDMETSEKIWFIWRNEKIISWFENIKNSSKVQYQISNKIQSHLLSGYRNILQDLAIESNGIFPIAGTMLGLVREGSLIAWDDDLDFFIDVDVFNENELLISKKADEYGWTIKKNNWINSNYELIDNKGGLMTQLFSKEKIEFDFGKLIIKFQPIIDLFGYLSINEDILVDPLEISKRYFSMCKQNGFDYTNALNGAEVTSKEINNFLSFVNSKKHNDEFMESEIWFNKKLNEISKAEKNDRKLNVIFSHYSVWAGKFRIGSSEIYSLNFENLFLKFILPSSSKELLLKQYGKKWKKPKHTHSHLIRMNNVFFK